MRRAGSGFGLVGEGRHRVDPVGQLDPVEQVGRAVAHLEHQRAGAAIAFLLLGVLVIRIFGGIWARIGMGAALVVVFGGLLLVAWYLDRKEKAKRAGIDELPRV